MDSETAQLKREVKALQIVCQRLHSARNLARKAADKQYRKRQQQAELAGEYKTIDEAQEAYGYGIITEAEFEAIQLALENASAFVSSCNSPEEIALRRIERMETDLIRELSGLEWELIPEKKKLEIAQRNEQFLTEHEHLLKEYGYKGEKGNG